MPLEILIGAALTSYVVSLIACLAWLGRAEVPDGRGLAALGPRVFVLAIALFTLPLSIRAMFSLSVEGDISPQVGAFAPYIPVALLYCAAFNVVFGASFQYLRRELGSAPRRPAAAGIGRLEWAVLALLVAIAFWMLRQLASEAGGLVGLVLLGYGVTETFVGAGHYAVGFEWLTGATVVALAIAFQARRRGWMIGLGAVVLVQAAAYAVMGRRGALVVLLGSCVYLFHATYRRLTSRTWVAMAVLGFLALNAIGLLRGDKYEDLASVAESVATRGSAIRESGEKSSVLYTVTTGHFAVPFETLPQVIRAFGDEYAPGLGAYTLRSLALFVPASLWEDRPLPLANWYMREFYGETVLNEGRQFFFLSEAYMNFGALGAVIWALLFAWGWLALSRLVEGREGDPLAASFLAIVVGSTLTIVAADTGFVVAFAKGYALPVIVVALVRQLRSTRARRGAAT